MGRSIVGPAPRVTAASTVGPLAPAIRSWKMSRSTSGRAERRTVPRPTRPLAQRRSRRPTRRQTRRPSRPQFPRPTRRSSQRQTPRTARLQARRCTRRRFRRQARRRARLQARRRARRRRRRRARRQPRLHIQRQVRRQARRQSRRGSPRLRPPTPRLGTWHPRALAAAPAPPAAATAGIAHKSVKLLDAAAAGMLRVAVMQTWFLPCATAAMVVGAMASVVAAQTRLPGPTMRHSVSRARVIEAATCPTTTCHRRRLQRQARRQARHHCHLASRCLRPRARRQVRRQARRQARRSRRRRKLAGARAHPVVATAGIAQKRAKLLDAAAVRMVVAFSISQILSAMAAMVAGTVASAVAAPNRLPGFTIGHLVSRARMKQAVTCLITHRSLASTPRRKLFQMA